MGTNNSPSDTHRSWAALTALAARQHGVISRRQAVERGVALHRLKYRVKTSDLVAVDTGVYRMAGTPETWHQRLMAACLAGPAVASHRSAAALWTMLDMEAGLVEVTALRHRRRHTSNVVWHESYHLSEREVTEREGIAVTKPVRTILDLGVVLDADPLEEVVDDALRRGLVSVAGIWRRWEQLGPIRPGARTVAEVLRRKVPGEKPPDSRLETRFRQVLRVLGIADLVIPQYEVRTVSGRRIGFADYAIPERKIAIELDGKERHSSRQAQLHDRLREADARAAGWRVERFGSEHLGDPDGVAVRLRLGAAA
jgi:hypothetical protein